MRANALEDKKNLVVVKDGEGVMTLMIQQKMTEAIQAGADTEVIHEEAAQKSMQYVLFPYTTRMRRANPDLSDEEKAEVKSKVEFAEAAKTAEDFGALATRTRRGSKHNNI